MKIVISSGGKFHSFELVQSLKKNDIFFFSSYPEYYIKKFFKNKIKFKYYPFFIKEIVQRLLLRFFSSFFYKFSFDYYINKMYENFVISKIKKIKNIDIFVGWSGFSYFTFQNLNNKTIKILERGSTHIKHQNKVIKKLNYQMGYTDISISEKIIKKEIAEYNLSDYIFTSSKFSKKTFLNYGIHKNKIFSIPYGCDLKLFTYKKKNKILKNKKFTILFVGEVSFRKGVHILLDSFKDIYVDYPNVELQIVGKINKLFLKFLKKNNKRLNLDNIKFINSQSYFRLPEIYNNADLFVLPTYEEGLALVNLQALSCNLPIISTPNSGCEDLIEHNKHGIIVNPDNSTLLKKQIIKCIKNPDLLLKFRENIDKKRKYFSWNRYESEIKKIYSKILQSR